MVANGVVYVNETKFYALNAATGAELWSDDRYDSNHDPFPMNGWLFADDGYYLYGYAMARPGRRRECRKRRRLLKLDEAGDRRGRRGEGFLDHQSRSILQRAGDDLGREGGKADYFDGVNDYVEMRTAQRCKWRAI